MATSSAGITQLYDSIIADLVPFYMDSVLLPNPQLIINSVNISGSAGDTVRFPLTNSYTTAGSDIAEGGSIVAAADGSFTPTAANITVAKRGVGTDVYEEAFEDGGMALVQNAVLTRLAGGLALATDQAGFAEANSSFTLTDTGAGSSANTHSVSFVMSPEALGFASKREPVVKMWFDPNTDTHQIRATVRNGFTTLRGNFGNRITCNDTLGSADANIVAVAKAVAQLRAENAPTMAGGQYVGVITPALEFAINEQIALAGGAAIGSLSDVGNRALLEGIIGQAAGAMLFRHTALPKAGA
jgi:hypothetical protein